MLRLCLQQQRGGVRLIGRSSLKALSTRTDSFLNGSNSVYAEQMYDQWKKDPKR